MKLVIDRKTWLRGEGGGTSYLLRSYDRKMCCLGFYALQANIAKETEIYGFCGPRGVLSNRWPAWLLKESVDDDVTLAMSTNDSTWMKDVDREAVITEIFARHDVEVEFV